MLGWAGAVETAIVPNRKRGESEWVSKPYTQWMNKITINLSSLEHWEVENSTKRKSCDKSRIHVRKNIIKSQEIEKQYMDSYSFKTFSDWPKNLF